MVTLKRYIGRTGNNLFQYAAARYVAQRNNLYLETPWCHEDFLRTTPWRNNGKIIKEPVISISDTAGAGAPRNILNGDFSNAHVILDGYFQDATYFNNMRDEIIGWFEPSQLTRDDQDWILHYRTTDYWNPRVASVISPDWYMKILTAYGYFAGKNGDYVKILTDNPEDPCVLELQKRIGKKVFIFSNSPRMDFELIRSHDRVICANSSFSWWAAFLGNPKQVYTFKKWMRYSPLNLANMVGATVVDGDFAINKEMESKNWEIGGKK